MLLEGEAEHVWGDGVYGKSLCFSLSFVVNLKLFKKKIILKRKIAAVFQAIMSLQSTPQAEREGLLH